MKGRRTPPPPVVVFAPPRANDPSQEVDAVWFEQHPGQVEYTRKYIAGETPELFHPDTWVKVMRIGVERVRGFAPPADVGRAN
jgi:hypothetical protein